QHRQHGRRGHLRRHARPRRGDPYGPVHRVPAERQARRLAFGRVLPRGGRADPRALGHPRPPRPPDPDRRHPAARRRKRSGHGRSAGGGMSADDNRGLIKRFYDEGWNANNLDVYDELVTDDFVDHQALPGLPPGREGFKGLNVMFRSAFPDVWVEISNVVAEEDKVGCRWVSTGTHTGDLFGIPPTGNK